MNVPTISYGDGFKEWLVDLHYFNRDDQRFPYLCVAYIEWEGERPDRSQALLSFSCHECGGLMTCELSSWTGFWGSYEKCPSCGAQVQIYCARVWEKKFRPGVIVCAMPFTTTKGVKARPIKLHVVEIRALETE
jgi:hypothetical protein